MSVSLSPSGVMICNFECEMPVCRESGLKTITLMRKLCHISFSSHEEVMFRCEEDINYAFNCFAVACLETDSRPLADSEMTTHCHFGIITENAQLAFTRFRYPYARYFNYKYGRRGRLGERTAFFLQVDGLQHSLSMLSYVFRQALHHGLSESSFGYRHNSVNTIFQSKLGKIQNYDILGRSRMSKYLPCQQRELPDAYRMNRNGLLLREDVIDTSYVEELFISPRSFLYYMNRVSSDAWKEEQMTDDNGLPPITLDVIEPDCYRQAMPQLLQNETGRHFRNNITDLELCALIDGYYLSRLNRRSIYELSDSERQALGNRIFSDFKSGRISAMLGRNAGLPSVAQIKRCAVIL